MIKDVWTIKRALEWTSQYFKKEKIENPRLNAEVLLAHILRKTRLELYLEFSRPLSLRELTLFKKLIIKRSHHVPLSYLTGEQDFMGLRLKIDENVYIPRPETEILVEEALKLVRSIDFEEGKTSQDFIIVDLGTGSGNIAIKLALELEKSKVYAVDISPEALQIARENARMHNLNKRITFLEGDLFIPLVDLGLEGKVDLMISNPPYVRSEEIKSLPPEVLREPRIALEGGGDGLGIYRKIISQSPGFLRKAGFLALEIGHRQAKRIQDLILAQKGLCSAQVISDYGGVERITLTSRI